MPPNGEQVPAAPDMDIRVVDGAEHALMLLVANTGRVSLNSTLTRDGVVAALRRIADSFEQGEDRI